MAEAIGRLKPAEQLTTYGMFLFPMQIMDLPLAREGQSSGQQMEGVTGLARSAAHSTFCTMCLLLMPISVLSLATSARFSEGQDPGPLQRRRQPQRLE